MFKLSLVLIVSEISSESHAISSLCWIATFASYVGRLMLPYDLRDSFLLFVESILPK